MKLVCSAILFSVFIFLSMAQAQTPGVAIAPTFQVIDGAPGAVGAYYRKVITPNASVNLGIYSRNGMIPEFAPDNNRFFIQEIDGVSGYSLTEMNDYRTGSRDRPSIYLGGRNNNIEIDAGLAWNRVYAIVSGVTRATWTESTVGSSRVNQYFIEQSGNVYIVKDLQGNQITSGNYFMPTAGGAVTVGTKTLNPNFAFRPYFRSSNQTTNAGYHTIATAGGTNDSRFYASDAFTMELKILQTGQIRLTISGGAGGSGELTSYTTTVSGFNGGSPSFKRVDSIDQKGREGFPTEPTNATVVRGGWGITSVLKSSGNQPFAGSEGITVKSVEFSQNTYNYLFGSIGQGRATRVDGSEAIYINPPNP